MLHEYLGEKVITFFVVFIRCSEKAEQVFQRERSRCKASLALHFHLVVIAAQDQRPCLSPARAGAHAHTSQPTGAGQCQKNTCE